MAKTDLPPLKPEAIAQMRAIAGHFRRQGWQQLRQLNVENARIYFVTARLVGKMTKRIAWVEAKAKELGMADD